MMIEGTLRYIDLNDRVEVPTQRLKIYQNETNFKRGGGYFLDKEREMVLTSTNKRSLNIKMTIFYQTPVY